MAGALLGGSYLDTTQFRSIDQIEDELKNITLAASVGRILKSLVSPKPLESKRD
jgi:hypothetical protein